MNGGPVAGRARALALAAGAALAALGAGCASVAPAGAEPRSDGEVLFRDRCARCHDLPSPHAYSGARWAAVLGRMQGPAGLDDRELQTVLTWVRSAR